MLNQQNKYKQHPTKEKYRLEKIKKEDIKSIQKKQNINY